MKEKGGGKGKEGLRTLIQMLQLGKESGREEAGVGRLQSAMLFWKCLGQANGLGGHQAKVAC